MNTKNKQKSKNKSIELSLPISNPKVFRYKKTADLLNLLSDNSYTSFSIRDLSRATGNTSTKTVSNAVKSLKSLNLIEINHRGNKKLVQIDKNKLKNPENPILKIPQTEFQKPIKKLYEELKDQIEDIKGIVIFGSVAKGKADRQSDIDCFVLTEKNQATNQDKAHKIAKNLREKKFEGERYDFQILVESKKTALEYGEKLKEILTSGITLYETDELRDLKEKILKKDG